MARQLVQVTSRLGFERFSVAGHDRGGRVAYRLALDHSDHIDKLAVLDVLPVEIVWERADARFALAFWAWSLLAQSEPLPERIVAAAPEAIIDDALGGWGTPSSVVMPTVRAAYVEALRHPDHAHAICEEYRAAATIDREHDQADRAAGCRIACSVLVLWSENGALDTWYEAEGGPLQLWRSPASDVQGRAVMAGHFFPEECPEETAQALRTYFKVEPPA